MKNLEITNLLDFYGNLLTDKMRNIMELYYMDDLSLAEISEDTGFTRQGVRDYIVRGEKELIRLEASLNLYKKFKNVSENLGNIKSMLSPGKALTEEEHQRLIKLIESVETIL